MTTARARQHGTATTGAQTEIDAKTSEIHARCTDDQKVVVAVAADYYGCSQAGAVRELLDQWFHDTFGDLDPAVVADAADALAREELQTLVSKDLNDDALHAELRRAAESEQSDADEAETERPQNYSAALVPAELEQSGPTCSWQELREVVKDPEDGGFWTGDGDLRIHPDRVGDETLRSNHKLTPRILVGIARWQADNDDRAGTGLLAEDHLTELVEEYCLHLTDRPGQQTDYDGRDHIRDTYTNLVKQHLWPHPKPQKPIYYTTKDCFQQALPTLVETVATAFDPETDEKPEGKTASERVADLFETVVMARRLANRFENEDFRRAIPSFRDETSETHRLTQLADNADPTDPSHQLVVLANKTEQNVLDNVDSDHFAEIGDELLDAAIDYLQPDIVDVLGSGGDICP